MFNIIKKNTPIVTQPTIDLEASTVENQAKINKATHSAVYRLSMQVKKHFNSLLKQEGTMTYGLKELNSGNLDTVTGIETISTNITNLSTQNENLATEIEQMANQLKVTNHHIADSTSTFTNTTQSINDLTTTLKNFSETMGALRLEFNQIASKVTTINEIAENTSLLALMPQLKLVKLVKQVGGLLLWLKKLLVYLKILNFFQKKF